MVSESKRIKNRLDRVFSLYIRLRDSRDGLCKCITCGKLFSIKEGDAGHFISRKHESTRYDEKNVAAQCRYCNRFSQGKQFEFGGAIDKKYGIGTAEKLLLKSKMACKRDTSDYRYMYEFYKVKLEELKNG